MESAGVSVNFKFCDRRGIVKTNLRHRSQNILSHIFRQLGVV